MAWDTSMDAGSFYFGAASIQRAPARPRPGSESASTTREITMSDPGFTGYFFSGRHGRCILATRMWDATAMSFMSPS